MHLHADVEPPDLLPRKHSPRRTSATKQMLGRTWHKVESWLKRSADDRDVPVAEADEVFLASDAGSVAPRDEGLTDGAAAAPARRTVAGLLRAQSFKRESSERRDRLSPHEPDADERRACSVDRRAVARYMRSRSAPGFPYQPSHSAPDVSTSYLFLETQDPRQRAEATPEKDLGQAMERVASTSSWAMSEDLERLAIQAELEAKWILNLSMHFKDRSDREKFFITYAEKPNRWIRVTVSCDYRNPSPNSLEDDLKNLHYQRDKSARIYESIRDSLPDIQFYPTVTNLKIKTVDGRLHVHCSEDVNEIVKYPAAAILGHISCPRFKESDVVFHSHLSGYVYKVDVFGRTLVKKEIPGPEAVDEFIYEANALHALREANHVIRLEGIIETDDGTTIKGILISLAARGALIDLIYDAKLSGPIPWPRRERWARQIITGLMEIHEAGFVQGDFTLSNIVLGDDDAIALIDINRRGCPVGWEPPEFEPMIASGQRIAMFISVKTDLFQLGMVLWALAAMADEPEREPRPLAPLPADVPPYYRRIVESCLASDPRARLSAERLLELFAPDEDAAPASRDGVGDGAAPGNREQKEYIDPATAISLEDIRPLAQDGALHAPSQASELSSGVTFADATPSIEYCFDAFDSAAAAEAPPTFLHGGVVEKGAPAAVAAAAASLPGKDSPDGQLNGFAQHVPAMPGVEEMPSPSRLDSTPASDIGSLTPTERPAAVAVLPPIFVAHVDEDIKDVACLLEGTPQVIA
jgi:hypothetical protein